jgi:hypothetical protein
LTPVQMREPEVPQAPRKKLKARRRLNPAFDAVAFYWY